MRVSRPWEAQVEHLVRERYGRLVGYAMLLTGSRPDAQDLVQDALISTFGGRARFSTIGEAEQYVRRAIASRSVDEARRRARERAATGRFASWAVPAVVVEVGGLSADLQRALVALSPRERACVVLRQLEDLSVRETAAALGLSEGAVKRYTSDGLGRLDAALGTSSDPGHETVPVRSVHTATSTKERRDA